MTSTRSCRTRSGAGCSCTSRRSSSPRSWPSPSGCCCGGSTPWPPRSAASRSLFWLVFFSTYDALAGIATGVLVRQANSVSGEERASFAEAADFLFDSHIGGNISWFAFVAGAAWVSVALAAAVALRGAGADWLTTVAAALSALFAAHAGYVAFVGLIALIVAAFLWERRRGLSRGSPPKRL